MKVSVFGLGYVGAVSAACLADAGHVVIGVDPQQVKVDVINEGRAPVAERDLDRRIGENRRAGRLSATTDPRTGVHDTDLALICVGTPSRDNGDLDLTYVERVCEDIGEALRDRQGHYTVVIRSTLLPRTIERVVVPVLEKASGRTVGEDLGVGIMPEFLREGTAVADFLAPPKVVIGASDDRTRAVITEIAHAGGAPVIQVDLSVAEMVKYVDNAWHAVKVAFANEVGTFAHSHGVDAQEVMDIFCQDRKLNISDKYLRPGPAFGGSCLPKDVRALTYRANRLDLKLPLLDAVLPSNERHLDRSFDLITAQGSRRVGVLGLSFKAGTDDLRESPMVHLVERLIGKGYAVRIYDNHVRLSQLTGANRTYLLTLLPHISDLIVDTIDEVLEHAETVVVGTENDDFRAALAKRGGDHAIVDFVRIDPGLEDESSYHGICW
jgi:GDP-mannose 6-dehydrogenase